MIKRIAGLALISSVVLFACKKSSNDSNNNANAILGKWTFVRNVNSAYIGGVRVGADTTESGNYIYFDTNGKAYSFDGNQAFSDTVNYSIVGNLIISGTPQSADTVNIQKLDAHSLIVTDAYMESNGGIITSYYDTTQYSK